MSAPLPGPTVSLDVVFDAPAGPPSTCANCSHFEPDTSRCARLPYRSAVDAKGKTRWLMPVVEDTWTCESFARWEGP